MAAKTRASRQNSHGWQLICVLPTWCSAGGFLTIICLQLKKKKFTSPRTYPFAFQARLIIIWNEFFWLKDSFPSGKVWQPLVDGTCLRRERIFSDAVGVMSSALTLEYNLYANCTTFSNGFIPFNIVFKTPTICNAAKVRKNVSHWNFSNCLFLKQEHQFSAKVARRRYQYSIWTLQTVTPVK